MSHYIHTPDSFSPSSDRSGGGGLMSASIRCDLGVFSCFHGKEDKGPPTDSFRKIKSRMEVYYDEARVRLPLQAMPELADCVSAGGLCFGLADPLSNIVLNAVGLLVHRELVGYKPPHRFSWAEATTSMEATQMPGKSYSGQLAFMIGYFRHLSRIQAKRYLHIASYDLALAINLVHHDHQGCFPSSQQHSFLPDGGKTKNALRAAAIRAEHPEPNVLARLMTAQYPLDMLTAVLTKLQGTETLTVKDLYEVKKLLSNQWPPTQVNMNFWCHPRDNNISLNFCHYSGNGSLQISTGIGEDRVAQITVMDQSHFTGNRCYISQLNFGNEDMEANLSKCLAVATAGSWRQREEPAWDDFESLPCEHILSLKLRLLDTIHAFYTNALARLPIHREPQILRAILVAGHCYGPLDPVSNIIVNSCWYDMAFPLGNQVQDLDLPHLELPGWFDEGASLNSLKLPKGILDTRSMSRLESRSLDGLVAALRNGASMSLHQALEFLSTSNCDISRALLHPSIFSDAAKVAKHPQYVEFGSFLCDLHRNEFFNKLKPSHDGVYRMDNVTLSQEALYRNVSDHLLTFVHGRSPPKDEAPPCKLIVPAAKNVVRKNSFVWEMLAFLSNKIDVVLHEYSYKHPWEPAFHLDVICGVNEPSLCGSLYHVNFLACPEDGTYKRTLFFAELWVGSMPEKLSSCSPVYNIDCTGRCSFCEKNGSKVVHPPSGGHFGDLDGSLDTDGSHGLLGSEEYRFKSEGLLLDTDYVYFDPARDDELAEALNRFHSHLKKKNSTKGRDVPWLFIKKDAALEPGWA
ncbi:hypothetical protein EJB05_32304, partial [Eragrostis curvula]